MWKVELRIGSKGRVTLPARLLRALGLREGDNLELEAKGKGILLKPKAPSVRETKGVAGLAKVDLEEIEGSVRADD